MDFIFASIVASHYLLMVAVSYDIMCQWFINLFVRMRSWPAELKLRPGLFLRPLIPKFYKPAHKEQDHDQYDFNFAEGIVMSDGETPERVWAAHTQLGNITKSTGPGTRHDVYDDHFGYWNWEKYIYMGKSNL